MPTKLIDDKMFTVKVLDAVTIIFCWYAYHS